MNCLWTWLLKLVSQFSGATSRARADDSPPYCFVKLEVAGSEELERLGAMVDALANDKSSGARRDDAAWRDFFTASELRRFWWPTAEEALEWEREWFATPLPQRHGPEMPAPSWAFDAMIETIFNSEYDLIGVRASSPTEALIEFNPDAYPYGGTGSLRMLASAFGHKVLGCDDGTGYRVEGPPNPVWAPRASRA